MIKNLHAIQALVLTVLLPVFSIPAFCSPAEDSVFNAVLSVGLPVVQIETVNREWPTCEIANPPADCEGCVGRSNTNANKVPGIVSVFAPDSTLLYSSGEYDGSDKGMTIKIRGNTSAGPSGKQPFKIKLMKKGDMLGREGKFKDKNWVLLADEDQRAVNGFKINELLERGWTPAHMAVNVVFNGQYHGLYLLVEAVERNTDCRINIEKTGFIAELDPYWWNEDGEYLNSKWANRYNYTFKYPDFEDMTDAQKEYIQNYLTSFENALSTPNYEKYLDIESTVSWIIGHDIMGIKDIVGTNKFFVKADDSDTTKLTMGTLWDFHATEERDFWLNRHSEEYLLPLFNNANRAFVEKYIAYWENNNQKIFSGIKDFLQAQATGSLAEAFDKSADMDAQRWETTALHSAENSSRAIAWYNRQQGYLDSLIHTTYKYGPTYTVEVSANNPAYGSVTGNGTSCRKWTSVEISANANKGYVFKKWNDSVTANPRRVTVVSDTAFTAIFEAQAPASDENSLLSGVNVSPNPSNGVFFVETPSAVKAEIYTANGTLLESHKWQNAGRYTVDLSGQKTGIYFLHLTTEGAGRIIKLVVR